MIKNSIIQTQMKAKLLFIIVAIFLLSCGDDDEDSTTPGGSSAIDTSLSGKLKSKTSIFNGNLASSQKTNYLYTDGLLTQKRTELSFMLVDSILFEYDSQRRPKYVFANNRSGVLDTAALFEYNNQGLLSKTIRIAEDTVLQEEFFTYSANGVLQETELVLPSGFSRVQSILMNSRNNLLQTITTKINGQTPTQQYKVSIRYDNSPNPHKQIDRRYIQPWEFFSSNSITSIRYYINNVEDDSEEFTLSYNDKGQVEKSITIDSFGGENQILYEYY